jgi:hypothetical protein
MKMMLFVMKINLFPRRFISMGLPSMITPIAYPRAMMLLR